MKLRGAGAAALTAALVLSTIVAGCGGSALEVKPSQSPVAQRLDVPDYLRDVAVKRPGKFKPPLRGADILVTSRSTLSPRVVSALKNLRGVTAAEQFSMASFYAEEQPVVYAAVNPSTFRRFTPGPTATYQEVWDRLADGEIALTPQLHRTLPLVNDFVAIGNDQGAQQAHVGSYAELVANSRIGALVNERWAAKLGMPSGNAMLISTGLKDPADVLKVVRKHVPKGTSIQRLALNLGGEVQTAVLTGGSVARAVGSFTYTINSDGSVNPDGRWVSQYIRTETVPILGRVTCNKAMLPQLRGALRTIKERGLASKINPAQYGGCYVPRFIASDPTMGLSFHTWGTAIDLNVSGNQRGTAGTMDPAVVQIFNEWGFNWGGTWRYTDPMHFEMARLVTAR